MNIQIMAAKSAQTGQNIMSIIRKKGHTYLRPDGYNIEMHVKKLAQPSIHKYTSATAPNADYTKDVNVGKIIDFLFG